MNCFPSFSYSQVAFIHQIYVVNLFKHESQLQKSKTHNTHIRFRSPIFTYRSHDKGSKKLLHCVDKKKTKNVKI